MLSLIFFIIPAVFVHLVTGNIAPSPVIEDMLLSVGANRADGGGAVPCGVCYDLVRSIEATVLSGADALSLHTATAVLNPSNSQKKRRNAFLAQVEAAVCPLAGMFGAGGGGGGGSAAEGADAQSTASHHSVGLRGRQFGRKSATPSSPSAATLVKPAVMWNCSRVFRRRRDAIAQHIMDLSAANARLLADTGSQATISVGAGGGVGGGSRAAGGPTLSTPGGRKATTYPCPLFAPLVPSISALQRLRELNETAPQADVPWSCAVQQHHFSKVGTGPVCSDVCEGQLPWADRFFMEVLRFIARHREVQLLCVCVREVWGVVLLLGLESGVIVLLVQLKGLHWSLQDSIAEALALRKPAVTAASGGVGPSNDTLHGRHASKSARGQR